MCRPRIIISLLLLETLMPNLPSDIWATPTRVAENTRLSANTMVS